MKKLLLISLIALVSCKKKECPVPTPEPIKHEVKYIVSGDKYWYKYHNPVTEQGETSDTVTGTYEINYTLDNWEVLTLTAIPDSNSYVSTIIIVDGEICHSDYADRQINLISSQSICNK